MCSELVIGIAKVQVVGSIWVSREGSFLLSDIKHGFLV